MRLSDISIQRPVFAVVMSLLPVLPIVGGTSRFQPVFVGDVAEIVARAVDGTVQGGRVYELGGPEVQSLREIVEAELAKSRNN